MMRKRVANIEASQRFVAGRAIGDMLLALSQLRWFQQALRKLQKRILVRAVFRVRFFHGSLSLRRILESQFHSGMRDYAPDRFKLWRRARKIQKSDSSPCFQGQSLQKLGQFLPQSLHQSGSGRIDRPSTDTRLLSRIVNGSAVAHHQL